MTVIYRKIEFKTGATTIGEIPVANIDVFYTKIEVVPQLDQCVASTESTCFTCL